MLCAVRAGSRLHAVRRRTLLASRVALHFRLGIPTAARIDAVDARIGRADLKPESIGGAGGVGATPVLVATQAAFVGVCLLFLLFARWVYGSPSRTTQAVLSLLDGLDLSSLNRDVRTIKGMNAELIQEHTKLVAKRGMRVGVGPTNAAAAQGSPATGSSAAASNEVRPLTGHTRPGSALLEGNIPAYAVGSYDSPVAGRVVPGASSTRTKDKKRNRSSVGRLNLPADALQPEAALVLPAPSNFALSATTARRSSVDGVAMKQMMATNLQLQAKVRDLESQQQGSNWKA